MFSSSSSVYGKGINSQTGALEDSTPKNPISPYAKSKSIVEDILWDYDTAHSLKSVSLRYFNAAGSDTKNGIGYVTAKDELPTHLIPVLCKAVNESERHSTSTAMDMLPKTAQPPETTLTHGHCGRSYALEEGATYSNGAGSTHTIMEVLKPLNVTGETVDHSVSIRRPGDVPFTFQGGGNFELGSYSLPKYNHCRHGHGRPERRSNDSHIVD